MARDDVTVSAPQLGKTIVLGLWALIGAWRTVEAGSNLPWWWAAPTYGMAEQGMQKNAEMARKVGLLRNFLTASPQRIVLRNGAVLEAHSWEVPENLFGPTVGGIAFDEFGYLTAAAHAALSSRVSETRTRGFGFMRYAGNVGEIGGEAETVWLHANSGVPGWDARTWTWRHRAAAAPCECGLNGHGIEIEHAQMHDAECERGRYLSELANLRGRMGPLHFRQLYGAEWLDYSALPAYSSFERAVNVTEQAVRREGIAIDLSCDFNVDPMAWVIGQHKGHEVWAFDEIAIHGGATTEIAAKEFNRRVPPPTPVHVYGDRNGNSGSVRSTKTDYAIIRELIAPGRNDFQINVPSDNPPVTDRLNAYNAKLRSASGESSYFLHPRCARLANDLARSSFKAGTRELCTKNKNLGHFTAADGYRVARLYPVRAKIEARRGKVSTEGLPLGLG